VTNSDDDLLAELRVRAVLERYCSLLDSGAVNELLTLFDENCTFTMMGRTYVGKAEFAEVWDGAEPVDRPATLHALVNPRILLDGGEATAVSGWILLDRRGEGAATQVALAGRYHDALRLTVDGQWRFTSRAVETLARTPRPA
jgi:3-phenylpropionate/cinnamic acid dioxygenase small subunit